MGLWLAGVLHGLECTAVACSSGTTEEGAQGSSPGSGADTVPADSAASAEVQNRLQSFLKQSSRYDPRLVLARIRGSSLWQEQVILHSKVHSALLGHTVSNTMHMLVLACACDSTFQVVVFLCSKVGSWYLPVCVTVHIVLGTLKK